MEITASILDYLGKYEGGILVSVGLMYNQNFYNSIFYYTDNQMIINVDESLIQDIKCEIEEHKDYLDLLKSIMEQCDPHEILINQLEEIKTFDN